MDGFKSILQSRTFWGAIVALAAGVLGIFHYTVSAADQASLVEAAAGIGAAVGGVVAIVGRVLASKQIGSGN